MYLRTWVSKSSPARAFEYRDVVSRKPSASCQPWSGNGQLLHNSWGYPSAGVQLHGGPHGGLDATRRVGPPCQLQRSVRWRRASIDRGPPDLERAEDADRVVRWHGLPGPELPPRDQSARPVNGEGGFHGRPEKVAAHSVLRQRPPFGLVAGPLRIAGAVRVLEAAPNLPVFHNHRERLRRERRKLEPFVVPLILGVEPQRSVHVRDAVEVCGAEPRAVIVVRDRVYRLERAIHPNASRCSHLTPNSP